jgi:outer membrane protein TolC
LKDCLTNAAATNQGLKAASLDVAIAAEQIGVAKSGYLPKVDLQFGYQAQLKPQAMMFQGMAIDTEDPDFAVLNLSIYNTLYDFGRTRSRVGMAQMRRDQARHAYLGSEQDLFLQVVRAYYGILEAGKLVKAAEEELAQTTSHQSTAQAFFDQGVVTRNDLLQAEVRVASSRQRLYSATNEVENGWLLLNYLTGQPASFRGELKEEADTEMLPSEEGRADFSKRGEIVALKDAVAAGDFAVTEAKSNYYPELFTKLTLDYVQNDKVREQEIMSAMIGLKVNLYDGEVKSSRLREAVQERARDEDRLRDLESKVQLELARARNDLKVARARIKVSEKAILQGVENLRITKDRYLEKVGTATEVVDAQTLLTQTRTDYFQGVFDLQVAAARVRRATGEL